MYAKLYNGAGFIAGNIQFPSSGAVSDPIKGALDWLAPASLPASIHPGFHSLLSLEGASYAAHSGAPVIGSGVFTLTGSDLEISESLSISAKNIISLPGANSSRLHLTIDELSGLISGAFIEPDKTPAKIFGVILQENNTLSGFFIGSQSGTVSYKSSPTP